MRKVLENRPDLLLSTGLLVETDGQSELALGTPVLTLDGEIPVEFLEAGDRIITRSGIETLLDLSFRWYSGPMIHTGESVPGRCRHMRMTRLTPESRVLMRDWRTGVIYGDKPVLVPAANLVDGDEALRVDTVKVRVFALHFATDQVIRSGDREIVCRATGRLRPHA